MNELNVSPELLQNYDDYYEDADPEWRRLGALDKAANIAALCSAVPHRTILEIGAGDGAILARLAEIGFGEKLHAVDISRSGVEAIKRRQIARLADCRLFDGYRTPYDSAAFDLVILSHVIEHVEHPRHLLWEAARVARYVFVEVPLEHSVRMPRDYVPDRVGHINFYAPNTIRRLVQSCGLRVVRQIVNNPSKATYLHQKGRRGLFDYYVKNILINAVPRIAPAVFVYHSALLCERQSP